MTRRPDHIPPRKEFPESVKRAIAERSGGTCEVHRIPRLYGLPLTCDRQACDFDHILPDGLGGPSTEDNGAHLCKPCHKVKSARDTKMIAKSDRQGLRSGPQKRRKDRKAKGTHRLIGGKKLQSRGFQKHPTLKRSINGQVKER